MPIANPSIQLYGNMKKLVTKLRNQSDAKSLIIAKTMV